MTAQPEPGPPALWQVAPAHPRMRLGAVHVWRANLARVPEALGELLSDEERARAERFPRGRDGRLWAASRGVLRSLLGGYLTSDPARLQIAAGPHGKPAVRTSIPLSFNLSHSSDLALFAFTTLGSVGVDVEVARRPIDTVALAGRVLGADAAARLERLEGTEREQQFLRLWVRHEASLKCLGTGMGGAGESAPAGGQAPWIAELKIGDRAAAAVAVDVAPEELCCWDWRGPRGSSRGSSG
jgi:4'-phosphopantetheinyl transferase